MKGKIQKRGHIALFLIFFSLFFILDLLFVLDIEYLGLGFVHFRGVKCGGKKCVNLLGAREEYV